jgi:hypothetical protein
MTEKLPLVVQETAAPTRKLKAGTSAGVGIAVTLVPILFPAFMQAIEVTSPEFAAVWGPVLAAVVSAIMAVLGGSGVAYVVKNRATHVQVAEATESMKQEAITAAIRVVGEELAKKIDK